MSPENATGINILKHQPQKLTAQGESGQICSISVGQQSPSFILKIKASLFREDICCVDVQCHV